MSRPDFHKIRILLLCALLLLLLGLLLGLWLRNPRRRTRGLRVEPTAAVIEEVRRIGELSSAGFYEELVITDRDNTPLGFLRHGEGIRRIAGTGDFVIICKGRVRAGFDLSAMRQEDFSVSGDTLYVDLPPVAVLDVIIHPPDYEHFSGHRSHEETVGVILQAKQLLRADAIEAGILDQAEAAGVASLERLLSTLGYRAVVVTPRRPLLLRPDSGAGR